MACCSKQTENVISCLDLESHCSYWAHWLSQYPTCIDQENNAGFTNKDLLYRNAFISHQRLQDDPDPWFFYVNEKPDGEVCMAAYAISDLKSQNETILRFVRDRRACGRYFLLAFRRGDTMLLFIKTHDAIRHLHGDDATANAYVAYRLAMGFCCVKKNFFVDDDDTQIVL